MNSFVTNILVLVGHHLCFNAQRMEKLSSKDRILIPQVKSQSHKFLEINYLIPGIILLHLPKNHSYQTFGWIAAIHCAQYIHFYILCVYVCIYIPEGRCNRKGISFRHMPPKIVQSINKNQRSQELNYRCCTNFRVFS